MMIPQGSLIYVINKPISARYGIPSMFDMLVTDQLGIGWNGLDPVVIVTLNKVRTICKVFIVDGSGFTCFTRRRANGRFKHTFNPNLNPTCIAKRALERLLTHGSLTA